MAVALDLEGLGDLDAAGPGDAADVVAREVDQHHVLGAFLPGRPAGLSAAWSASMLAPRGRVPASGRMVTLVPSAVRSWRTRISGEEPTTTKRRPGGSSTCRDSG